MYEKSILLIKIGPGSQYKLKKKKGGAHTGGGGG
eukprot:SAG11_NODE_7351_length_1157_cov_1.465974_1_plen_33_part_10